MARKNDGLALKPPLSALTVVLFHFHCSIIHFCEGQSHVVGPPQPIAVFAGDDITLPCHLKPAKDAADLTVEWSRPDLNPRFVHVWHEGQELAHDQNPSYRTRTSLSTEQLKLGDLSLRLSGIKPSDKGRYRCFVPQLDAKAFIDLAISSTSSPVIVGVEINRDEVLLQCESAGWFPEPELLWLDAEGNLLSAGPTETVRGSDDLYTVSSRVTVEKRHSSRYTCRVQQTNTNQTTEAHIHVAGDFLMAQSCSTATVSVCVIVAVLCILAVIAFVLWKRKKDKSKSTVQDEQTVGDKNIAANNDATDNVSLMKTERKRKKDEDDVSRMFVSKLKENLEMKVNEEEQEDLRKMIETINRQKEELKTETKQRREQMEKMETLMNGNEAQAEALHREITEQKIDKSQGYLKLKKIMTDGNFNVKKEIQEQQKQQLNTQKLMQSVETVLNKMSERKKKLEEETEKCRNESKETLRLKDDVYGTQESEDSDS